MKQNIKYQIKKLNFYFESRGIKSDLVLNCLIDKGIKKIKIESNNLPKINTIFIRLQT